MIKIAVSNRKGGVGKTSSSINLAACFARMGMSVLLVDVDPQTHSSKWLGAYGDGRLTICDVIYSHIKDENNGITARDIITPIENFYLAPGSENMAALELELQRSSIGRDALADVLAGVEDNFDICIIDCPPNLGTINANALVAADYLLIPLRMGVLDLDGVAMLLQEYNKIKRKANPNLEVLGIFGTFVEGTRINEKVREMLLAIPQARPYVLSTVIAKGTIYEQSPDQGVSIFNMGRSREVRNAASNYVTLAKEILTRMNIYEDSTLSEMTQRVEQSIREGVIPVAA